MRPTESPRAFRRRLHDFAMTEPDSPISKDIFHLLEQSATNEHALIRCAQLAGADGERLEAARTGAMTYPNVALFAVRAVRELREDYDNG